MSHSDTTSYDFEYQVCKDPLEMAGGRYLYNIILVNREEKVV
jgi:hypothetical protein